MLQAREFERLGGTNTIQADIRLIAATNKDLEAAIVGKGFREDLFYRLNVFAIFVPPLRERKTDVLQLANFFLDKFSSQHGKKVKRIATPAIDMLMAYHWPGNVRELENAIERAIVVCNEQVLHAHHLPPTLQTAEETGTTIEQSLDQATEAFEKDILQDALKSARGNRAKAAQAAENDRSSLQLQGAQVRDRLEAVQGVSVPITRAQSICRTNRRLPSLAALATWAPGWRSCGRARAIRWSSAREPRRRPTPWRAS